MDRMMRNVFMQIGEDQQQFEHPVALFGVRFVGLFFQILDRCKRIGQKPLEICLCQWAPFPAAVQGVVCAHERLVEKMIQAELLGRQRSRYGVSTRPHFAIPGCCSIHRMSQPLRHDSRATCGRAYHNQNARGQLSIHDASPNARPGWIEPSPPLKVTPEPENFVELNTGKYPPNAFTFGFSSQSDRSGRTDQTTK